jgi:hypothetical protein
MPDANDTIILIRPDRGGWEVFEAPGVQPRFGNREYAINYAQGRTVQRRGEIRIFNAARELEQTIPFDERSKRD